jgi:hypothetical protein
VELKQGVYKTWHKGLELKRDDERQIKKMIEEVGFNAKRNGLDADFVLSVPHVKSLFISPRSLSKGTF